MPISPLFGQAQNTAVLKPGTPGAPGGPGGPPPPTPGTGWELRVISAVDYSTVLCWVPQRLWNSNTFSRMLNSQAGGTQGSGTVVLAMDDPWWKTTVLPGSQPAHFILDEEHVWQVWQNGVLRHEFLGETVTEQLVQQGEQRLVTVTGPDTSQVLNWAAAMPPGFPNNIIYKTEALTDSFDEVNGTGNYVIDTGLWNASSGSGLSINPAGSLQVNGTSGGTVLGTTAWDLTNSLFSAQVSPIVSPDAANNTLNGSQLTQLFLEDTSGSGYYVMIALSGNSFYAAYNGPDGTVVHTIDTAAGFNTVQSSGSTSAGFGYGYWQISESNGTFYFWTSSDGQTWTKQWSKAAGWTANNVGVYFAAQYVGSTAEFATVTSLNSDVVTSALGGATYITEPIISVWLQTLAACQARGTVPWVTTLASNAADSYGNPWTDSNSVQIQNGTSLYQLLQGQAAMVNADWVMNPGFELVIGIPAAVTPNNTEVTLGYDRSPYVRFYEAGGVVAKQRQRARNAIVNLVAAINGDGRTISAQNATSIGAWAQREAWVQAAAQVTTLDLEVVADAAVEAADTEVLSWTLQITPNVPGRTVFQDFDVGDWVGLERPDFSAVDAVRVVGITVSIDQNGTETHELTLVSYIQWLQQQLTWIQTKMGGGFVSASGTTVIPDNAQSSTLQSPTVFTETYGKLGTTGAAGGTPMVYNAATGIWVPAGTADPVSGQTVNLGVSGGGGTTTVGGGGVTVGSQGTPGPLNANYAFPAGSSSGWSAQGGTLTVVTSSVAPAGAPAAYVAKVVPTRTSTVFLTSQAGTPQVPTIAGIIPGGSFTVTAYVYLASQSDMTLSVKVDWYNSHGQYLTTTSGTTGTIGASSWQQISFNATPPSAATQCNIFVGPHTAVISPSANPLYVTDFYIYNANFGVAAGTTTVTTTGTTVTDPTGTTRVVTGLQSDGTITNQAFNAPPPLAPDNPVVTNVMLGVNVAWDGLLGGTTFGSGTSPLYDFLQVQVHASTSSGFTPSNATLQATLTTAGNVTLTQLTAGTAYYIVLVAVNDSGAASTPSVQVAGTPQTVATNIPAGSIGQSQLSFTVGKVTFSSTAPSSPVTGDLWYDGSNGNELKQWSGSAWVPFQFGTNAIQAASVTAAQIAANTITGSNIAGSTITGGNIAANTITADALAVGNLVNQNPFFGGGSTAGWTANGGTLVGTTSPPTGAPYPAAGKLTTNGSTTNPAIQGTAAPFPVVASAYYLATAWVYTAQTNVIIGITWLNSSNAVISTTTTTVAVTASTWTNVSSLDQAPAGAVSGYMVCGLPSVPPNNTLLYATEIRLFSPFNGGIIQAGTITTAQLAAGSVTASQIAANTITAGNIAAGAIGTAQLAAGAVTATTIAAGTIFAGIVNGTTITGASVVADGSSGELLIYAATPAAGNLVGSWSANAGTDSVTNPYKAGLWVYDTADNSIGLVPGGGTSASQLAFLNGGTTPTPVAGGACLYGASSGTVQLVDGSDGTTYGTARRSLIKTSAQTIANNGAWQTFFSSPIGSPTSLPRWYRITGSIFMAAGSSATGPATVNVMWSGPGSIGGELAMFWVEGTSIWSVGVQPAATRITPSLTLGNGTPLPVYVCNISGFFNLPSSTTGTFIIQGTATSAQQPWQVVAGSFIDILPV